MSFHTSSSIPPAPASSPIGLSDVSDKSSSSEVLSESSRLIPDHREPELRLDAFDSLVTDSSSQTDYVTIRPCLTQRSVGVQVDSNTLPNIFKSIVPFNNSYSQSVYLAKLKKRRLNSTGGRNFPSSLPYAYSTLINIMQQPQYPSNASQVTPSRPIKPEPPWAVESPLSTANSSSSEFEVNRRNKQVRRKTQSASLDTTSAGNRPKCRPLISVYRGEQPPVRANTAGSLPTRSRSSHLSSVDCYDIHPEWLSETLRVNKLGLSPRPCPGNRAKSSKVGVEDEEQRSGRQTAPVITRCKSVPGRKVNPITWRQWR